MDCSLVFVVMAVVGGNGEATTWVCSRYDFFFSIARVMEGRESTTRKVQVHPLENDSGEIVLSSSQ